MSLIMSLITSSTLIAALRIPVDEPEMRSTRRIRQLPSYKVGIVSHE